MKLIKPKCETESCPLKKVCVRIATEVSNLNEDGSVDIMFIGEAPGVTEEETGRPFIGYTGSLLRNVIGHLLNKYKFTYAISNLVKARPRGIDGNNRTPTREEREACLPNVHREILRYNPKIIVAVGGVSYYGLYEGKNLRSILSDRSCVRTIKVHGTEFNIIGTPHPSWILRQGPMYAGLLLFDVERAVLFVKGVDFRISNDFKPIVVDTMGQVEHVIDKLSDLSAWIGCDTETRTLGRVYDNDMLAIQLCANKSSYLIPLKHFDSPFSPKQVDRIGEKLKTLFCERSRIKGFVFWNAPFDLHQLLREFKFLPELPIVDAKVGVYALEDNFARYSEEEGEARWIEGFNPFRLSYQAWAHGFTFFEDDPDQIKKQRHLIGELPLKNWTKYACADPYVTKHLFMQQIKIAHYHQDYREQFVRLMTKFYSKASKLLTYIEHCGLPTNMDALRALANPRTSPLLGALNDIRKDLTALPEVKLATKRIMRHESGCTTNLFGTPQVFDPGKASHRELLLFGIMKLKPISMKKTKVTKGKQKGFKGVLAGRIDKEFKEHYSEVPAVRLFNDWDRIIKLKSTYVDSILNKMSKSKGNPDFYTDHRIRPHFFETGAVTGRFSSRDPNTQQRVARGDRAETILAIYESSKGRCIVKIDYRVHEVRGLQIVSGDPNMAKTFNQIAKIRADWRENPDSMPYDEMVKLTDVHRQNATIFFNVTIDKVTPKMRQDNKNMIFGTIYGMGIDSLASRLGTDSKSATKLQNTIFKAIPVAHRWLLKTEQEAEDQMFVESPLGRRRRLWGFLANISKAVKARLKRMGRNSGIQGMCSDISTLAGFEVLKFIKKHGKAIWQTTFDKCWCIMNLVHDSNELEIPIDDVFKFLIKGEKLFTSRVSKVLERDFGLKLQVPLEIDIEVGLSFSQTKKWDGTRRHAKELQKWLKQLDEKRR